MLGLPGDAKMICLERRGIAWGTAGPKFVAELRSIGSHRSEGHLGFAVIQPRADLGLTYPQPKVWQTCAIKKKTKSVPMLFKSACFAQSISCISAGDTHDSNRDLSKRFQTSPI